MEVRIILEGTNWRSSECGRVFVSVLLRVVDRGHVLAMMHMARTWNRQDIPSKSVCDLPDNVHRLIDDFWLVNCYDLFGPWPGSEHGQYSCPTAHIKHHLQVRRSNSLGACFISLMKGCGLWIIQKRKIKSIASRKLIWLKRKVVSCCISIHIYVLHHLIGNEHSSGFLWHV